MESSLVVRRLWQALFDSDDEETRATPAAASGTQDGAAVPPEVDIAAAVQGSGSVLKAPGSDHRGSSIVEDGLPSVSAGPPRQTLVAHAASRCGPAGGCVAISGLGPAEAALNRNDQYWWRELVNSTLRRRISLCDGIIWKMPTKTQDPFAHCLEFLSKVSGVKYYIGITESPVLRWEAHSHRYSYMYVVWVADSSRETAQLEMRLLDRLAFKSLSCENDSYGGERPSAGSPDFLYICTRESGLMRGTYPEPRRGSRMGASVLESLYGPCPRYR